MPATWDVKTGKNIKWVASLGSQSYGNPVVASGVVIVGTNNEAPRDPKQAGDRGVLMAFGESDGEFLWQITHEKLASGRVNDWPYQGVASSPLVEGRPAVLRLESRRLIAVDIRGLPRRRERRPVHGREADRQDRRRRLVDVRHDGGGRRLPAQPGELLARVLRRTCSSSAPATAQDESHVNIPSPKAPSIIAVDKKTGKLVWEDDSPGDRILHGQWSTPAVGTIGGIVQVMHGQGDGWVRGYEAATGKKLWEFDTNPKDSVWPKTRNEIIGTPVDLRRTSSTSRTARIPSTAKAPATCTPSTRPSAATSRTRAGSGTTTDIRRSISTAAIKDGIVYHPDFSGFLHAIDVKTGKQIWKHDMFAAVWASTMVADGKIYLGDEDGDVVVMQHGREKKILAENMMDSSVYSTVVTANGVMYIMTRNNLYAIAEGAQLKR